MSTLSKKCMQSGFTLIELMVSMALFSVVVVIVGTAYLNLLSLDRQTRATNDISDNLSFVMDAMSRAIRTGTNYACGGGTTAKNCATTPSSTFTFIDTQGNYDTYVLNTTTHQVAECPGLSSCTSGSSSYTPLTDPRITVTSLNFYVRGVGNSDYVEPQVTFSVHGTLATDPTHPSIPFTIQTGATDRQIDI